MYRSRLVPRIIPTLGLVGAPLLIAGALATFFGYTDQVSALSAIGTLPVAAWELSLALWLVIKGFNPSPIITSLTNGPSEARAPCAVLPERSEAGGCSPRPYLGSSTRIT
jgi:Domain of unknown function (DUF4386)